MKKCTKCGNLSPDTMNFCSQCGEPLDLESSLIKEQAVKPKRNKKRSLYILLLIGVFAALVIVLAILGVVKFGQKESVTGTWQFEKMEVTKFPVTDWESAGIQLQLKDNNRFILKASDQSLNGSYEVKKSEQGRRKIVLNYDDKTDTIFYVNDHIYISHKGYQLILSRK